MDGETIDLHNRQDELSEIPGAFLGKVGFLNSYGLLNKIWPVTKFNLIFKLRNHLYN